MLYSDNVVQLDRTQTCMAVQVRPLSPENILQKERKLVCLLLLIKISPLIIR